MEQREPQLIVATGSKGVGKTYTTLLSINRYIRDNPNTGKKGRKVLIYDANMEEAYRTVKTISLIDVGKFTMSPKVEIRRLQPISSAGKILKPDEMADQIYEVLENFQGGLLVLEDINKYLIDTKTVEIIGAMSTNRHKDLDIICHLQSLSAMTTRMWQNTSIVRFHWQKDDIYRYKNRVPVYDMFKIAQHLVNNKYFEGNKRFYCHVSQDDQFIKGAFSKEDFQNACEDFLMDMPRVVQACQTRFGRGDDARKKAIEFLTNDFMNKYYGGAL